MNILESENNNNNNHSSDKLVYIEKYMGNYYIQNIIDSINKENQ